MPDNSLGNMHLRSRRFTFPNDLPSGCAGVVRRLDSLDVQERPQPVAMPVQLVAHFHQPRVSEAIVATADLGAMPPTTGTPILPDASPRISLTTWGKLADHGRDKRDDVVGIDRVYT